MKKDFKFIMIVCVVSFLALSGCLVEKLNVSVDKVDTDSDVKAVTEVIKDAE